MMDSKRWELFVNEKTIETNLAEVEGRNPTRYATLWMLINLFRFLLDWHDEWKAYKHE